MKIVTWNINRFNGNRPYNIWIEAKKRYAKKIHTFINDQMTENDDVVFLQEIPYKDQKSLNVFEEEFKGYKVLSWYIGDNTGSDYINRAENPIFLTVALVKEGSKWNISEFNSCMNFEGAEDGKYNYVNRYIQIEKQNDISVMGLHWPAKNKKQNYNGVKDLNDALNKTTKKPNIILGDFNAGDYDKSNATDDFKDNRNEYIKLLGEYTDVCNGDTTTNYYTPTAIDHVLVERNFAKVAIKVEIHHEIELSDHYPIVVTLNK